MTQATQINFGEIKLAGDLAGSNDANSPQLTATGVTPGQYIAPTITVDAKGRITNATSGTSNNLVDLIPEATATRKGIVKIGSNINYTLTQTQGTLTVNYNGALTGTSLVGMCTNSPAYTATILIDGVTTITATITAGSISTINDLITAVNGQISPAILELTAGNLRLRSTTDGTGSSIRLQSDNLFKYISGYTGVNTPVDGMGESTIYLNDASTTVKGVAKLGSGFTVAADGTANFDTSSITNATTTQKGVVKIGAGIDVTAGVISTSTIPDATTSTKGIVQVGNGINVTSGVISIPDASQSTKGIFKVGYGLKMTNGALQLDTTALATANSSGLVMIGSGLTVTNGVLSAGQQIASVSNLGMVKIGAGIDVAGDGTISANAAAIPDATYTSKGVVQIGSNINVTAGVISVPTATASVAGIVQPGTTLGIGTVTAGVLDVVDATVSQKGAVQIGSGINVSSGTISIPWASTGSKGIVQISGQALGISSGVLSANAATASTLGVVKPGTGLSVASGVLSVNTATTGQLGVVQIGAGLSVASGVVSLNTGDSSTYATTGQKGIVQVGSGISVASGVISIPTATSSVAGIASVNTSVGLSVTGGQISAVTASGTTTLGVVKANNSNNINILSGGLIDTGVNVPLKNTANTYTGAQVVTTATPAFSASMTLDLTASNSFSFTATSNFTLNAPTNQQAGQVFYIIVKQDATGGRTCTWNSAFKFRGGTPASLSTAANSVDLISCVVTESGFIATEVFRGLA